MNMKAKPQLEQSIQEEQIRTKRRENRLILSAPLERLVVFLEQRGDVRSWLAESARLANTLRRLGFPVPSIPRGLPWSVVLVMRETPHVVRIVLVALVARRAEGTPMWPAGSSPRQVAARLRALWLAMLDALDPAQLDPWLPLGERASWFLRRVTQIYRRNVRVGDRLPPEAVMLTPLDPVVVTPEDRRRIEIVPAARGRRSTGLRES
jgi:hypothetical protein